jgi:two-component system, NarL family, invasion response regulator UvrY
MINVFIADDHSLVRRGIKNIISDENDIQFAGEASNVKEIMDHIYKNNWDVLVLDITMPGKNGLDALIEIKKIKPDLKVVILTMHHDEEIVLRALKTGASGFVDKESVPGELIKAIRKVYSGSKYISSSIAEIMALSYDKDKSEIPHNSLSKREYQVMCLLASGNSLKEIANELSLSVKTVSTYRARVLEKMKLKSNVEIAHYAIKHNLVV